MRLIDADKLITELRKSAKWHKDRALGYFSAITHIEEQPTAYDTEKVIKELFNSAQSIYGTNIIRMEDAIEIVKAGGQNDVHELIKELHKIPNQNLPVWIEENYLRIGELLFIMIKEPEDDNR